MKYAVILGDGMADYPSKALGGRTPLEVANKPNIDDLCKKGKLGLVKTVPDGMKPGYLQQNLADEYIDFHAGVSYRHCLVAHNAQLGTQFTPPHDITGKKIAEYLPQGEFGDIFLDIMIESYKLLKDHPINQRRIAEGLRPANSIWLWGEGTYFF